MVATGLSTRRTSILPSTGPLRARVQRRDRIAQIDREEVAESAYGSTEPPLQAYAIGRCDTRGTPIGRRVRQQATALEDER